MNIDLQAREITPLRHTYDHVARHIGGDKVASRYQEATIGAQPMVNFHYRPTWDPAHELFDASRSKIVLASAESPRYGVQSAMMRLEVMSRLRRSL